MSAKVRFEVLTDRQYRPLSGDFIVRLALRMSVPDLAETLPLNICLLIDRSLSMDGPKMDRAKESAKALIQALREEDYLSIVSFSTNAQTLVEHQKMRPAQRRDALNAVDGIQPGGITRLDLALECGFEVLTRGGADDMNILLLLSDGAPTDERGVVLPEEGQLALRSRIEGAFTESSMTTSTIGLGDAAECLAPFLESCGEKGGGIFYHADDPRELAERFMEELDRVKDTAVADLRFQLRDVQGSVRKAVAVYPNVRELHPHDVPGGAIEIDGGALVRGEDHVFLVEVVTRAGNAEKKALCEVEALYRMEGRADRARGTPPLIEYTGEIALLEKPGHPDVEKYKSMYAAFIQTQKAAANIRAGGDIKKTRVLLRDAAKTTRRLGLTKQTKLLEGMANQIEAGADISANDLTRVALATRKTKLLGK